MIEQESGRVPDGTGLSSPTEPASGLGPSGFDPSRGDGPMIESRARALWEHAICDKARRDGRAEMRDEIIELLAACQRPKASFFRPINAIVDGTIAAFCEQLAKHLRGRS